MKVLFLDIDGVLNVWDFLSTRREVVGEILWEDYYFSPNCMKNLKRVIEATGCKIVLSSVWRKTAEKRAVIDTNFVFNAICPSCIIGRTPFLWDGPDQNKEAQRGIEILQFIKDYNADESHTEKITTFAVVDDSGDMNGVFDRFVRTKTDSGLTEEIADKLIAKLMEESS